MKKNIHPEYHNVTVVLTNGESFETRSTYGKANDSIHLDIDPLTHPAWTGFGHKLVDTGGQISKFGRRYQNFGVK
jgi:large subunit ribosomal protein L31